MRFSDEELKHQELFRRRRGACSTTSMPGGLRHGCGPERGCARSAIEVHLGRARRSPVNIELFVQSHYEHSIDTDAIALAAVQGHLPIITGATSAST